MRGRNPKNKKNLPKNHILRAMKGYNDAEKSKNAKRLI